MGMGVTFSREEKKHRILMKVSDGLSFANACRVNGISHHTGLQWCTKDKAWKTRLGRIKEGYMKQLVEDLIIDAARGGTEVVEEMHTWVEENEFGEKIQKTRKVRKIPPSEKAMQLLAKKYHKDFTGTDININHEIGITIKDRALSLDERKAILEKDKKEGQVIDIVDAKVIEMSDIDEDV